MQNKAGHKMLLSIGKIRAIGIDDGYFKPHESKESKLIGVVLRSDCRLEGIISGNISVDGLDVTEAIISMIRKSRFYDQIRYIFLSGINFAGFNIADLKRLNSELSLPVIAVSRKKPNIAKITKALERFADRDERKALLKKAGRLHRCNNIYFQCVGIEKRKAQGIIRLFTCNSNMPEPVRLAHIIASGITLGQSTSP